MVFVAFYCDLDSPGQMGQKRDHSHPLFLLPLYCPLPSCLPSHPLNHRSSSVVAAVQIANPAVSSAYYSPPFFVCLQFTALLDGRPLPPVRYSVRISCVPLLAPLPIRVRSITIGVPILSSPFPFPIPLYRLASRPADPRPSSLLQCEGGGREGSTDPLFL